MHLKNLLRAAGGAVRANIVPGLILQSVAVAVLALYYLVPAASPGFEWFMEQKLRWGFAYSALATSISGGLVPALFLILLGHGTRNPLRDLAFYLAFWAIMGIQVDAFYRLQGALFGNAVTFSVLARKVAVDQFIFSAFWATPLIMLSYIWKNAGFSLSGARRQISRELFTHQYPTMMISAWIVWIPAVTVIYSLPPTLQIPMFNIVQCFWSLLVEALSAKQRKDAAQA